MNKNNIQPYQFVSEILKNDEQLAIYHHCRKSYKDLACYFVNKNEDNSLDISETTYGINCIGVISCGIFLPFEID